MEKHAGHDGMLQSPSDSIAQLELTARKRGRGDFTKLYHSEDIVYDKFVHRGESKMGTLHEEDDQQTFKKHTIKRKKISDTNDQKFKEFSRRAARVSIRIREIKYPRIHFTPLIAAAIEGDYEKIKSELRVMGSFQVSAMEEYSGNNRNELRKGINFQHNLHDGSVVSKWSALRYACYYSRTNIIKLLLAAGASLTEIDLPRETFTDQVREMLKKEQYRRRRLAFLMGSISAESRVFHACFNNVLYDKNAIHMIFNLMGESTIE